MFALPGPVFFLSGDSFPKHERIENALKVRLASRFSDWIGQEEILVRAGKTFSSDISERTSMLEREVSHCPEPQNVVLIGRSSGARIATLLSLKVKVAAIISLGYPFRSPWKTIEVARFNHLRRVSTPCLFIQGQEDEFGGLNITEDYCLAPSITIRFVTGGHAMLLRPEQWDDIGKSILSFCTSPFEYSKESVFDETYYLQSHPDVQAAVSQGLFASGKDHYKKVGFRQKRRFRLGTAFGGDNS